MKSLYLCESVIQTVEDMVKGHGGIIEIKSEEGQGSEFIISLPIV